MDLLDYKEWPALNPVDTGFRDSTASVSVIYNLVRFEINVDAKNLSTESPKALDEINKTNPLLEEFLHYQDNFDEGAEEFEG